jgi:energy-coupling factor transporter ATP-binding protein EcfA2
MAHLIDVEVHGLAGKTTPTRIVFDRYQNILYGLNGSGKTSLLKILHAAMTGEHGSLKDVPFTRAVVRIRSELPNAIHTRVIEKKPRREQAITFRSGRRGLIAPPPVEAEAVWGQTVESVSETRSSIASISSAETATHPAPFEHGYLPTTRLYLGVASPKVSLDTSAWTSLFTSSFASTSSLTEESLDKNFAEALKSLWSGYTSEVGRSVRETQARGLANILKAVVSGRGKAPSHKLKLDLEKAYESVKQFLDRQGHPGILGTFANFQERYNRDSSLQAVVYDIYSVEQEVDTATEPQKRLERLIHRLYSGNKRIVFTESLITVQAASGDQIGLESLSSGEKQLMRMFVECLRGGPNTILIDEPEISVHIDWQRELMANLQLLNRDAQYVVATHSPEILAEVADERLFSL